MPANAEVRRAASRPPSLAKLHRADIALFCPTSEEQVISDARRIVGEQEISSYLPEDPREFASRIFHTCYMGTENSSIDTRKRAKDLAEAIGR